MTSKLSSKEKKLYLPILNALKTSTNLSEIQKDLSISKQNLHNYLVKLKKEGYIIQKGRGWYEVNPSKLLTNHSKFLQPDFTRGHAYVWVIRLSKEIGGYKDRIDKLTKAGIHFNLIGAKGNTPRIKVLGRKVWLCNDSIRIYDKPKESYYGATAIESRYYAFSQAKLIVGALNRKLGLSIKPSQIVFNKEHYALIQNDLAIEENKRGNIMRISDEDGEWLLIDDSLGQGGELENIGKKAFKTNVPMQKWWNDQKHTKFEVTPSFILESISKVTQNQEMFAKNIEKHMEVLEGIEDAIRELRKQLKK